jgi:adenine-specific DNA methylase
MSVAMPKHQAKEPIDLDIIIVCRKRSQVQARRWNGDLWGTVTPIAAEQIRRLRDCGRLLSRNDVRVIVMAQLLRQLSVSHTIEAGLSLLDASDAVIEALIERLYAASNGSITDGRCQI